MICFPNTRDLASRLDSQPLRINCVSVSNQHVCTQVVGVLTCQPWDMIAACSIWHTHNLLPCICCLVGLGTDDVLQTCEYLFWHIAASLCDYV